MLNAKFEDLKKTCNRYDYSQVISLMFLDKPAETRGKFND